MRKQTSILLLLGLLLAACSGSETAVTSSPELESEQSSLATSSPVADPQTSEADDAAPAGEDTEEQLVAFSVGLGSSSQCAVTSLCGGNARIGLCGQVTDTEGALWQVPPIAGGFANVDVSNSCSASSSGSYPGDLETQIIDAEGSEITAYLFADNYYEFYVNGVYAGRDAVNFTPFNSHAAQFQAAYPITYAVLLVDWEEYAGIGLEERGGDYHIGDGGFAAAFSDGRVTNTDWVCKAFYIAPLDDPSCVSFDANGNPDSSACPSSDQQVSCVSNDPEGSCQALHVELPSNWMAPEFDDSGWLPASTYTADEVTNSEAYRDYAGSLFAGADFIWTSNLDLDNLVACRITVPAP